MRETLRDFWKNFLWPLLIMLPVCILLPPLIVVIWWFIITHMILLLGVYR